MPRRLHHIALGAHDVEGVAAFYRDVLGLAETARHETPEGALRSIWLDLGGSVLMVEHTEASAEPVDGVGKGPFLLAVAITPQERPALEAALEAAGAPVESRSDYSSYARDPEGNRVAISHYPERQAGPA
jgi:catechol 2,3-dioxygenase-like lactoylglutathione lyase family enzyme